MACFTVKSCCNCINLRLGTSIIAFVCAVIEFISLLANFWVLWDSWYMAHEYVHRFAWFMLVFLPCLKLALCASLYVGLLERRPDHLEIWYTGYMVCELMYLVVIVLKAISEADTDNFWFWLMLAVHLLLILTTVYFILVVRSYHHQMCRQPNFYQDFSYLQTNKTHSGNPKDANGDIVLFSSPAYEKEGLSSNFTKNAGMVYATPQSAQMNALPIIPSFLQSDNARRPSVVNVEKQRQRRESYSSKPPQKRMSVGYENHIDLE